MQLLTPITLLLSAIIATDAKPVDATSKSFYLKTKVISGNPEFNGLYPWSYHTGAGESVPTLGPNRKGSIKSYFDGTRLNADMNTTFPWGWQPGSLDSGYAAWGGVNLNAGIGKEGFALNKTKGRGDITYNGLDWVACQWVYGDPQIMQYQNVYYIDRVELPCNCARVRLMPEYVKGKQ